MSTESKDQEDGGDEEPAREPYTPPVIERFAPMRDVTFGSSANPDAATVLVGP